MLYIRMKQTDGNLCRAVQLLNCVNDDRFLGFNPGCLQIVKVFWETYVDDGDIHCFLNVDVSGTADRVGPFSSLNPKTNRIMRVFPVCWERRRFAPVFGPTPDLRAALTDRVRRDMATA